MAYGFVEIGCSPHEEECVQVSPYETYLPQMKKQLQIFKRQMERICPDVFFKVQWNQHDFGSYGEVIAIFNEDDEEQTEMAFDAENKVPEYWDEEAKAELKEAGLI